MGRPHHSELHQSGFPRCRPVLTGYGCNRGAACWTGQPGLDKQVRRAGVVAGSPEFKIQSPVTLGDQGAKTW
jgi:hypothetical protein